MRYHLLFFTFVVSRQWGIDLSEVNLPGERLSFAAAVELVITLAGRAESSGSEVTTRLSVVREELRWYVGNRQVGYLCWGESYPQDRHQLDEAIRQGLWSGGCIRRPVSAANLHRLLLRADCHNLRQKHAACYYWQSAEELAPATRNPLPQVLNRQLVQEQNLAAQILEIRRQDGTLISHKDVFHLGKGLYLLRLQNGAVIPFWSEP